MKTCLTVLRYTNLNSTEKTLPSRLAKIQKFEQIILLVDLEREKKAPLQHY